MRNITLSAIISFVSLRAGIEPQQYQWEIYNNRYMNSPIEIAYDCHDPYDDDLYLVARHRVTDRHLMWHMPQVIPLLVGD